MTRTWSCRKSLIAAALVLLAGFLVVPAGTPLLTADGGSTTYSGQATGVRATILGLDPIVVCDTGPLPPEGGCRESYLIEEEVPPFLHVEVPHASTCAQGDHSRSEASVANVVLTVGGNTIVANLIMARAEASCQPGGSCSTSGGVDIVALDVNGQRIAVTGQPNQVVNLPIGQVIINEQTVSQNGGTCDIVVNALHIVIPGIADVVIASAHADINCQQPVCPGGDFVTGGGWITGTPSGARGNFGVAGGLRNSGLWGHLTYIDHGSGMKVKGTAVTDYAVIDDTTRRIRGQCEINHQGGFTYEAVVWDRGEPGRNDSFSLKLSNGYAASGNLDGGNIQLHLPCR